MRSMMPGVDNTINHERFSNDYYYANLNIKTIDANQFQGGVVIYRRDTSEEVPGGFTVYGDNQEGLKKEVNTRLKDVFASLPSPPNDWRSKTRELLFQCLQSEQTITSWSLIFEDLLKSAGRDNSLSDQFIEFCIQLIEDTVYIVKEIEGLSGQERKELLISNEDVYENPEDPYNMDELSARQLIYKYFIRPTKEEKNASEFHNKRWEDSCS